MNYPIMHLQHNSISVVRQYIETSQQCKMEATKIVSSMQLYSQLDKHVSRLAASAINDDQHCRSGRDRRRFGRLQRIKRVSPVLPASPASPVFSITAQKKTLSKMTSDTLFANVGTKETALNLNLGSCYIESL